MHAWKNTLDGYKVNWNTETDTLTPETAAESETRIIPLRNDVLKSDK
jgi:hypothetical protein